MYYICNSIDSFHSYNIENRNRKKAMESIVCL